MKLGGQSTELLISSETRYVFGPDLAAGRNYPTLRNWSRLKDSSVTQSDYILWKESLRLCIVRRGTMVCGSSCLIFTPTEEERTKFPTKMCFRATFITHFQFVARPKPLWRNVRSILLQFVDIEILIMFSRRHTFLCVTCEELRINVLGNSRWCAPRDECQLTRCSSVVVRAIVVSSLVAQRRALISARALAICMRKMLLVPGRNGEVRVTAPCSFYSQCSFARRDTYLTAWPRRLFLSYDLPTSLLLTFS